MNEFPFSLFLTHQLCSIQTLDYEKNIFDLEKNDKKSIFDGDAKPEVVLFIQQNKIPISKIKQKNPIYYLSSNIFDGVLLLTQEENKFLKFAKQTVFIKKKATENLTNISQFMNLFKSISYTDLTKYNQSLNYENPCNFYEVVEMKDYFPFEFFMNKAEYLNSTQKKKWFFAMDSFFYANRLNITLPCLGAFDTSEFHGTLPSTMVSFFLELVNISSKNSSTANVKQNINKNIVSNIPLLNTGAEEYITFLLFQTTNKSRTNNVLNIGSNINENSKWKKIVQNHFRDISFSLKDIMMNQKTKKVIRDYLIPFIYSDQEKRFLPMKKSEVDNKTRDVLTTLSHNNELLTRIIENGFSVGQESYFSESHVIDICACFTFVMINLFCEIHREYIRRWNQIIIDISMSPEKKFKALNITAAFDYITLLEKSLFKFRLNLLNQFYELYLPARTDKNSYGMKRNDFDCFIPEGSFLVSNKAILEYNPFASYDSSKKEYNDSHKRLLRFFSLSNRKYDLYSNSEIIETGAFLHNPEATLNMSRVLYEFYLDQRKKDVLNLFLIQTMTKLFQKEIPIECFNDLHRVETLLMNDNLTQSNKELLYHYFYEEINMNLKNSSIYLGRISDILYELKTKKNIDSVSLSESRDVLSIASTLSYLKAAGLRTISQNMIFDKDISNRINNVYEELVAKYEETVIQKTRKIETQTITVNKNNLSYQNIESFSFTHTDFWTTLASRIKGKKIFVLYNSESKTYGFPIIEHALKGYYETGKDQPLDKVMESKKNLVYCVFRKNDIQEKQFLSLKGTFVSMLRKMEDTNSFRTYLYQLLTNSAYFIDNSRTIDDKTTKKIIFDHKENVVSFIQMKKVLDLVD